MKQGATSAVATRGRLMGGLAKQVGTLNREWRVFAGAEGHILGLFLVFSVLAGVGFLILFSMRRAYLLPMALTALVLVPRKSLPDYPLSELLTLPFIIMVVWCLRRLVISRPRQVASPTHQSGSLHPFRGFVVFLALWFALSAVASEFKGASISWIAHFMVLVIAPILLGVDGEERRLVKRCFVALTAAVSMYAIAEWIVGGNPLYDPIYAFLGESDVQVWSTYRSHVSFGHPLYASLFLSLGFGAFFTELLTAPSRTNIALSALSLIGVASTVSRSGLLTVAGLIVFTILVTLFRRTNTNFLVKIALTACMGGLAVAAMTSPLVQERLLSSEAESSVGAREAMLHVAVTAAGQNSLLGSGPGTSSPGVQAFNSMGLYVENGYLQLLVSVGLVGLIGFALILVFGWMAATKKRIYWVSGMIVAYAVQVSSFNFLESNPAFLLLVGLIVSIALSPKDEEQEVSAGSQPGVEGRYLERSLNV
jgi:polysaccharide biosynthesis protein PslJ